MGNENRLVEKSATSMNITLYNMRFHQTFPNMFSLLSDKSCRNDDFDKGRSELFRKKAVFYITRFDYDYSKT